MNLANLLGGGAPLIKRYKSASTFTAPGGYATDAADGTAGVTLGLVTTVANQVGLSLDTCTYSTTQGDAEAIVSLIVNPDAILKIRMGSSTAAGTQLAIVTNSVAETAGTVITITTGDDAPNSPTKDEGTAICISGANVGQSRKITSTAATTATVTVPFLNDIASGDVFLLVPWAPADVAGDNIQLTTNLQEARQDIAVGTGADLATFDLEVDFSSVTNARQKSYVYALFTDHVYGASIT